MCVELPILKRCCCVPLRTGLAAMGIVKMIILASSVIYGIYCLSDEESSDMIISLFFGLIIFLAIIDFLFTTMLLRGVYLRHAKLLIISCYYTIVMTAKCSLISGAILAWQFYVIANAGMFAGIFLYYTVFEIAALILILMFQFYMFLLIRSVIYEVTDEINIKFWWSAADNQSLIVMESTDKNNVMQ